MDPLTLRSSRFEVRRRRRRRGTMRLCFTRRVKHLLLVSLVSPREYERRVPGARGGQGRAGAGAVAGADDHETVTATTRVCPSHTWVPMLGTGDIYQDGDGESTRR